VLGAAVGLGVEPAEGPALPVLGRRPVGVEDVPFVQHGVGDAVHEWPGHVVTDPPPQEVSPPPAPRSPGRDGSCTGRAGRIRPCAGRARRRWGNNGPSVLATSPPATGST